MAGSTINGNAGAQANGAIVYATRVDFRGARSADPIPTVVAAGGNYTFSGLVAGTYDLTIVPNPPNNPNAAPPVNPFPPLTQPLITVDGTSTYQV